MQRCGNRAKARAVVTAGRAATPYAGVQNYGWRRRNITPSYFLNRAADTKGEEAADLIAAGLTPGERPVIFLCRSGNRSIFAHLL